jgi:hypothetical protein
VREDKAADRATGKVAAPLIREPLEARKMKATAVLHVCAAVLLAGCRHPESMDLSADSDTLRIVEPRRWSYRGELHKVVSGADRIVIRDGGLDCCGSVDGQRTIAEITDADAMRLVLRNLAFEPRQMGGDCLCCGYPGLDWYRGSTRLALTSVKHGSNIAWGQFPSSAALTQKSATWLKGWLVGHGVSEKKAK